MKHKSHGASTPRPQLTKHESILGHNCRVVYRERCSKGDLVVPILCSCASSTLWHSVASDRDTATTKKAQTRKSYQIITHWTLRLEQICLSLHHPIYEACVLQPPNLLSSDNSNNFAKPTAARPAWGMAAPNHLPPLARHWGELAATEQEPLENYFVQMLHHFLTLKLKIDHESSCQGQIPKWDCHIASKHRANKDTSAARSCWIVWKIKSRHRPECQSGRNYCGQKGQRSHHVEYMWRLLLAQSVLASMFLRKDERDPLANQQKGNAENIKSI